MVCNCWNSYMKRLNNFKWKRSYSNVRLSVRDPKLLHRISLPWKLYGRQCVCVCVYDQSRGNVLLNVIMNMKWYTCIQPISIYVCQEMREWRSDGRVDVGGGGLSVNGKRNRDRSWMHLTKVQSFPRNAYKHEPSAQVRMLIIWCVHIRCLFYYVIDEDA